MLECFLAKLRGSVKSITIWLNGIGGLVLVSWNDIQNALPQIERYVSANAYKYLALSLVLGNIFVRFRTKKPLEDK